MTVALAWLAFSFQIYFWILFLYMDMYMDNLKIEFVAKIVLSISINYNSIMDQ